MKIKFELSKIPLKPALVSGAIVICLFVLIGISLASYRYSMMTDRQNKLINTVESVYDLVDFYYVKIVREGMAEADAKEYALQAIRNLPYDVNGYAWINDMQGVMIMHPTLSELNGRNLLDLQDSNGFYLIREFIATVQTRNSGFVGYMWPKPGGPADITYPKLSFVKGFAPWGWVIGSGIYIDDVDTAFRHAIYVSGGLILMVLLFVIGLIVTFSESLRKP